MVKNKKYNFVNHTFKDSTSSRLPVKSKENLIYSLRNDYSGKPLDEKSVPKLPLVFFNSWLQEAIDASIAEPNAFTLSTASPNGAPSGRVLLLREATAKGFVFFTNYNSRKGKEMELNPRACISFFWKELSRQVRIEGKIKHTSPEISDAYFASRPRDSQLGALASDQSEVVTNRTELENRFHQLEYLHRDKKIPRPAHWGGIRLLPDLYEFWQGRENRMHDRIQYTKKYGGWKINRLAP